MRRKLDDIYHRMVSIALLGAAVVIAVEARRNRQPRSSADPPTIPPLAAAPVSDPLKIRVGDVDLSAVPLRDAMRVLADRSGANLDADWQARRWIYSIGVEEAVLGKSVPVNLHRWNPTLGEALGAICTQFEFADGTTLGLARDPAGILLLSVAGQDGRQRSVTTLPRFYDVDDLIGPAPRFERRERSVSEGYNALLPRPCRPELLRLAAALNNFAGPGDVGCFGHWLMVNGYEKTHANIAVALDRIRHPIPLTEAATLPSPAAEPRPITLSDLAPVSDFRVPSLGMSAREALKQWEKAGAGHAVVELAPEDFDELPDVVGFELHDATLEQIAEQIVGSPFVVVPRGAEDDRVHIRRAPVRRSLLEPVPRAYDVSAILAHSDGWIEDARANVGPNENITAKEDLLIRLVSTNVDLQVEFRSSGERQIMACWNGILLVQETPEVHVKILKFLEHLHRTGRPNDPTPDQ